MSGLELKPCGGCGESDPSKRCMGCFHDFGDDSSAWVRKTTRTPDPAQIRADAIREAMETIMPLVILSSYDRQRIKAAILALLATPLSPPAVDNSPAPDAGGKEGV